jgi:alpha-1,2-mannosyltransferase
MFVVQGARLVARPRGDFKLHLELARRLVAGEFIYRDSSVADVRQVDGQTAKEGALDYPYPPFWAVAHAPLTLLPRHAAQVLLYPLIAVALFVLLETLSRLSERELPIGAKGAFWVSAAAVLLASRFVVRDAPECGVNLALVALSWLGVALWMRRREAWGGCVLGFAIALKCTPALFLPYFVLKRQWKMVAATTAATAVFTLSPILIMGPSQYARTMTFWFTHAWEGFANPDPSMGVLGDEQLQNVSLRPALARFLMHLPSGHRSRFDHPLSVDFFDLSPVAAGVVVKLLLLALVAGIAWQFRRRVAERSNLQVLWECATVSVLILLLSPITWGQHCVGVIPMLYLYLRAHACGISHARWMYRGMAAYAALTLGLNRAFIGKEMTWLLDSYRLPTWCLLVLLTVAVGCRIRHGRFSESSQAGRIVLDEAHAEPRPVEQLA